MPTLETVPVEDVVDDSDVVNEQEEGVLTPHKTGNSSKDGPPAAAPGAPSLLLDSSGRKVTPASKRKDTAGKKKKKQQQQIKKNQPSIVSFFASNKSAAALTSPKRNRNSKSRTQESSTVVAHAAVTSTTTASLKSHDKTTTTTPADRKPAAQRSKSSTCTITNAVAAVTTTTSICTTGSTLSRKELEDIVMGPAVDRSRWKDDPVVPHGKNMDTVTDRLVIPPNPGLKGRRLRAKPLRDSNNKSPKDTTGPKKNKNEAGEHPSKSSEASSSAVAESNADDQEKKEYVIMEANENEVVEAETESNHPATDHAVTMDVETELTAESPKRNETRKVAVTIENVHMQDSTETAQKDDDETTLGDRTVEYAAMEEESFSGGEMEKPPATFDLTETANTEAKSDSVDFDKSRGETTSDRAAKSDSLAAVSTDAPEISEERKSVVKKHEKLQTQYTGSVAQLIQRGSDGLEEEDFDLGSPSAVASDAGEIEADSNAFPDAALSTLLVVVQESPLPVSQLTTMALAKLQESFPSVAFTSEMVSSKIKVVATRESYIPNPEAASGSKTHNDMVNVFEDTNPDRMWRWEVTSLDLLPKEVVVMVKKARTARRKLRSHFKALCKLLASLRDANKLLCDPKTSKTKLDATLTKISNEEEKVLKYERDEEKSRLLKETRKAKALTKKQEQIQKEVGKKLQRIQKEEEKKRKQLEKQRAKELKQQAEEAKRIEKEEKKRKKEDEEQKEQMEKERQLKKQRSAMMRFFAAGNSHPPKQAPKPEIVAESTKAEPGSVDTDKFLSLINTEGSNDKAPIFASLSSQAIQSRRRRTRKVPVSVYVSVLPADPFNAQPYLDQLTIHVPNKFKFLSFHEDLRPPYYGTWSKGRSATVTGKNPFGQDTQFLDYEVDSEAEWEEGDDEFGEDLEENALDDDEASKDDEEGDPRMYSFQDGWLAADDDLGDDDEDIDEDTKLLRKKKLQSSNPEGPKESPTEQVTVCIIAPRAGGLPLNEEALDHVEGVDMSEAIALLSAHESKLLGSDELCLDAFPPPLVEEGLVALADGTSNANGSKQSTNQEMSREDLKTFAQFVHHCSLPSKDSLVEELRETHKTITSSRAQATRKLDSIAVKKRHPSGGVLWEVKPEILEELGLEDLLNKEPEIESTESPAGSKKDMTSENLKTFVEFVHNCTLPSKDKVVEELRETHKTVTSSRAQAIRKLDAIATKRRRPSGGVVWQVKQEVLEDLGLEHLANQPLEEDDVTLSMNSTEGGKASSAADSKASASAKKRQGTKRKTPEVSAASIKLFESFLKKKGKTADSKT